MFYQYRILSSSKLDIFYKSFIGFKILSLKKREEAFTEYVSLWDLDRCEIMSITLVTCIEHAKERIHTSIHQLLQISGPPCF